MINSLFGGPPPGWRVDPVSGAWINGVPSRKSHDKEITALKSQIVDMQTQLKEMKELMQSLKGESNA